MPRFLAILLLALGGAALGPGAPSALGAGPSALGDFNGDGRADLAVGVPFEDVGTISNAGAVNVIYGTASGLAATGNQFWHQNSPGIADAAEVDDHFGSALAAGDFNGDGRGDLAVGVPEESIGDVTRAGAVNVLYGTASGLAAKDNQLWHQDRPGIVDVSEQGDSFGAALTAADFNGDLRADLAVGAPAEDVGSVSGAGAVNVIYGSASRLVAAGNQFWHQNRTGVLDVAERFDRFGDAMAAGDFNGDLRVDLAVGVPSEIVGGQNLAGAVNALYGSASGLSATGNQFWNQDSTDVLDAAEATDMFGSALAAGDFNNDTRADLAVGVPDEDLGIPPNSVKPSAGAANVLYGAASGLSATDNQFWNQDSPDVLDAAELDDSFGRALAAGDFNGDGRADLAVGANRETVGTVEDAGAANVLYGAAAGLSATGNQFWHQDSPGVLEAAEQTDHLGEVVTGGDLNGDGRADLALGVPLEEVRGIANGNEGAVSVLYADATALSATGNQLWHQASPGILDAAETNDQFGLALASGAAASP